MNMINTINNSSEGMINEIQSLKGKTKFEILQKSK